MTAAGIRAELQKMGVAVLKSIAVPTVWFLHGLNRIGLIAFFLSPTRTSSHEMRSTPCECVFLQFDGSRDEIQRRKQQED